MLTPEVAETLSITPRMVQKHMMAAMAHLQERLSPFLDDDNLAPPARCRIPRPDPTPEQQRRMASTKLAQVGRLIITGNLSSFSVRVQSDFASTDERACSTCVTLR